MRTRVIFVSSATRATAIIAIVLAAGALMSYGIGLASKPTGFFFAGLYLLACLAGTFIKL